MVYHPSPTWIDSISVIITQLIMQCAVIGDHIAATPIKYDYPTVWDTTINISDGTCQSKSCAKHKMCNKFITNRKNPVTISLFCILCLLLILKIMIWLAFCWIEWVSLNHWPQIFHSITNFAINQWTCYLRSQNNIMGKSIRYWVSLGRAPFNYRV